MVKDGCVLTLLVFVEAVWTSLLVVYAVAIHQYAHTNTFLKIVYVSVTSKLPSVGT